MVSSQSQVSNNGLKCKKITIKGNDHNHIISRDIWWILPPNWLFVYMVNETIPGFNWKLKFHRNKWERFFVAGLYGRWQKDNFNLSFFFSLMPEFARPTVHTVSMTLNKTNLHYHPRGGRRKGQRTSDWCSSSDLSFLLFHMPLASLPFSIFLFLSSFLCAIASLHFPGEQTPIARNIRKPEIVFRASALKTR